MMLVLSTRSRWIGALAPLVAVGILAAAATAHTSATQFRWFVINKDTYVAASPGLEARLVTDPVLEWPAENPSISFAHGTVVPHEIRKILRCERFEFRARGRLTAKAYVKQGKAGTVRAQRGELLR